MKVLVACEYSGIVRDAFEKKEHLAVSCDFLASETSGHHYRGSILDILHLDWNLLIAHPPCTYLSVSGARWYYHPEDSHLPIDLRRPHPSFPNRQHDRLQAIKFFLQLATASIDKICIENPIGIMSTILRKPDQIIQPWQFGHGEIKATCLWLKNLPLLIPTDIVSGREARVHKMTPSKDRGKERSRFYTGIANAMAEQWS